MFHFESTLYLYTLLLVPLLIGIYLLIQKRDTSLRSQFGSIINLKELAPNFSLKRRQVKFTLLCLTLGFILIALANPRLGQQTQKTKRKGVNTFIALDISKSMWAEDCKPNRMQRSKQFVNKLIQALKGNQVGLILFAGQAYLQMPLTYDYSAAQLFTRTAQPNAEITQGTAYEEAIKLAVKATKNSKKAKQSAIILVSDGENHEQGAIDAAKEAKEAGVKTFIVSFGSVKGAPIPLKHEGLQGFQLDKNGEVVQSKMNKQHLQEITTAGEGILYTMDQGDRIIENLLQQLNKVEAQEFEAQEFDEYHSYFQYFLFIALLLVGFNFVLSYRK